MKYLTLFVIFGIFSVVYSQNACITPNGERAQCISIYQCRVFVAALKNRTPEIVQFMRASRCGYTDDPLVCCGSVANYQTVVTPEPITQKPITTDSDPLKHRNINLLAPLDDCGNYGLGDRITNGNITEIDEYPWTVLLEYKNKRNGRSVGHVCGGVLIGPKYVLTAAHCVVGAITREVGDLFRVRFGEYDQATSPIDCVEILDDNKKPTGTRDCNEAHQDINVQEAIAHPGYVDGHPNRYHDIAIVRLEKPVVYNDFVKPICMPLRGESKAPGQYLDVAGWGVTETGKSSSIKLKATIPIVGNRECARIYSSNYGVQIHDKQLCAGGEGNVDSCNGDSGGPLMTLFPKKTEYYVEGIVSFGARACGTPGVPGVYTRVASYNNWILDNMKQ